MTSTLPGLSEAETLMFTRAFAAGLAGVTATTPLTWKPLPHQIPPPGNWRGWLLLGGRFAGKALELGTMLPTPTGWTTMADVRPGDFLLDEQGKPCRVTLLSPVMVGHDCYRVRFGDGTEIIADAGHRWTVWSHAYRKSLSRRRGGGDPRKPQCQLQVGPELLTTEEMIPRLRVQKDFNLAVPIADALVLPDVTLPIDPYVLGVWLGDGHTHAAAITTMEPEVVQGVEAAGYELVPQKVQNAGRAVTYAVRAADHTQARSLHQQLRLLGLLHAKSIPPMYLRAGLDQRLRLMQGLMDTDGHVDAKGCCEFAVSHEGLAEGFRELVCTLGWKATVSTRVTASGRAGYRVRFNPDRKVVTVARKLARLDPGSKRQSYSHRRRTIVAIDPVPSVPVQCIAVDSPSHLYLASRSMVPTHNTDAGAAYMCDHVNGPPCLKGPHPHWMGIVAPTLDDAGRSCFSGPSGIQAHDPTAIKVTTNEGTIVKWPNGSQAKLFGTDTEMSTDRLRSGGNNCLVWAEEIAAWRWLDLAWAHMLFGLRTGPHPRWVGTTTPKPRTLIKNLDKGKYNNVVVVHATSRDNPYITAEVLADLVETYGGTSLGEQELEGRIVEQDENALWKREQIALYRLTPEALPDLQHITVGVDPSGGAGEQGIIVVGKHPITVTPETMNVFKGIGLPELGRTVQFGFVLDDRTPVVKGGKGGARIPPEAWGRAAVQAAVDWEADDIVVEVNFGGDMAVSTIVGAADAMGVLIPVRKVTASRGKRVRAEPVAALAARGRVPHVGVFEALEDQLATWTPDADYSPDRLDGMVWGVTHLGLVSTVFKAPGSFGSGAASRSLATWNRRS